MSKSAVAIANDSKFAVQVKRIEGFFVLPDTNVNPLTTDPTVYFQKLWIYPGASATAGVINANVGSVRVGNTAVQLASKTVTLQLTPSSTDKQTLLVTATCATHGFNTGDKVRISGASDGAYNYEFAITKVDANSFTFMLTDLPATNAPSGTIKADGLQAVPAASAVLADTLLNNDLPLKYELALGQKQQLSSILLKGAQNDGVFYRIW